MSVLATWRVEAGMCALRCNEDAFLEDLKAFSVLPEPGDATLSCAQPD